jgi:pimeloyl-ACP methyl ester carboxylesterase
VRNPRFTLSLLVIVTFIIADVSWPAAAFDVGEVGSFHIGGRKVTLSGMPLREGVFTAGGPRRVADPNGDFQVEQMYVQYIKLANPKARYPLLMWHGGGMTGVMWETKPDGASGWHSFFLKAGHDVYISDAVERGRASWARYPEIWTEPFFRSEKEAWDIFRMGPLGSYVTDPARRVGFPDGRFPIGSYDQFMKQLVPRWATNDAATQAAYDQLVQKVCPCVIMMFSQGGNFGFTAALHAPDKVKAIIGIEPSGAPDPAKSDITAMKGIPHLFVNGDHLNVSDFWMQMVANVKRYQEALATKGGISDVIDLPKLGIKGNTHAMMMDNNSDQIAALIQDWMNKHNLMK